MTKQEQIEEMANISTKEEIEARNKRDKEKDELSQALLHYATAEASGGIKTIIDCEGCAFYLYEMLGYRKIPEDSVVLSKGAYESLSSKAKANVVNAIEIRKETAEEIYTKIKDSFLMNSKNRYALKLWLKEQFGVEIKE